MVDYFTKWVEAKPVAQITDTQIQSFVWKSLIYRFGLPLVIITNNGKQFDNRKFKKFLAELHIKHRLTLVAHPQSNGEAKATNQTIFHRLKIWLTHAKSSWTDDLYNIL